MEKVKKWKLPMVSKAPWWARHDDLLEIELWKDSIWRIQGLSILKDSIFHSWFFWKKIYYFSITFFNLNLWYIIFLI
jgi:hypothetical protein